MKMDDALRVLDEEDYIVSPGAKKLKYRAQTAQRLDELTGHSKAIEACRAVITHAVCASADKELWSCSCCDSYNVHNDECPVLVCEAAVAIADK